MKIERKPSAALLPTPVVLLSVAGHGKERPDIVTLAWVGVACSAPPMLSVALRPARHSHLLVSAAREFVVNIPRAEQLEQVDLAGVWSGAEHEKFEELGLTARPARQVAAPVTGRSPRSTSSASSGINWISASTTSSWPRWSRSSTTRISSTLTARSAPMPSIRSRSWQESTGHWASGSVSTAPRATPAVVSDGAPPVLHQFADADSRG